MTSFYFLPHLHLKLPHLRGFLCAWLVTASSCQNNPTNIFLVSMSARPLKFSLTCFVWPFHPFSFLSSFFAFRKYSSQGLRKWGEIRESFMCPFCLLMVGIFFLFFFFFKKLCSILSHFSVALEIVQLLWILLCSFLVKQSYIQQNWDYCNEKILLWDWNFTSHVVLKATYDNKHTAELCSLTEWKKKSHN